MLTPKRLRAFTNEALAWTSADLREAIGIREAAIRDGQPMGNPGRFSEYQDELCMIADERRRRLRDPNLCPLCGKAVA